MPSGASARVRATCWRLFKGDSTSPGVACGDLMRPSVRSARGKPQRHGIPPPPEGANAAPSSGHGNRRCRSLERARCCPPAGCNPLDAGPCSKPPKAASSVDQREKSNRSAWTVACTDRQMRIDAALNCYNCALSRGAAASASGAGRGWIRGSRGGRQCRGLQAGL